MSRNYRPGDTYYRSFPTSDATGAAVNADSLPTGKVIRNGAYDVAITPVVSNLATGIYSVTYTLPGTYAAADVVEVEIDATISTIAAKGIIDGFRLVGWPQTALPNAAANAAGGLLTFGTGTGQINPSTGRVGPNWANVGSPTTAVNLSSTTISTAQAITAVTGGVSVSGISPGAIGSAAFAAGTTIPRVTLVDTLTTYTGNTPQTGNLFSLLNPMIVSGAFTTVALANAPSGSGGGGLSATTLLTFRDQRTTTAPNVMDALAVAWLGVVGPTQPNAIDATQTDLIDLATPPNIIFTYDAPPPVVLATAQPNYAPAKAGNAMALTSGERTTLAGVILADTTDTLGADIVAIKATTDTLAPLIVSGAFTPAALAHASTLTIADIQTAMTNQGYTTARAPLLSNLDAAISSRSTFTGGAVASVTAPVTVGTNNDKTGYSLTQTFPTNFAALAITPAGAVTAGTVSDKTGYSLAVGSIATATFATGATIPHVTLVDTLTTYTGNTPQTGNLFALLNPMIATGAFTSAALVNVPGGGPVVLAASQPNYAPAKPGDAMTLTTGERATLATAILTDTTDTLGANIVAIRTTTDKFLFDASNFVKSNPQTTISVGPVTLATAQPNYAPARPGDAMTLTTGERTAIATAVITDAADMVSPPTGSLGAKVNSASSAGDPLASLVPGSYGAGTAGHVIGAFLDAAVSGRLAAVDYTAPNNAGISAIVTTTTSIKTQTDKFLFDASNFVKSNPQTTIAVGPVTLATAQPNYAPARPGDAMTLDPLERIAVAAAVIRDTVDMVSPPTGSLGDKLNGAASAGDPLASTVPGAYGAGTAGFLIGNLLDVAISSRLAATAYTAPDNAGIATIETTTAAIQTQTDKLRFDASNFVESTPQTTVTIDPVTLAADQPNYAPARPSDAMTLTTGERTAIATAVIGDTTDMVSPPTGSLGAKINGAAGLGASIPTVAEIATAVVTDTADLIAPPVGSLGAKINAAGAAGDPLATDLSTAGYTWPQAGAILQALDKHNPLVWRDQTGNTTPNGFDADFAAWFTAFGTTGAANLDGTISALAPDGTTTIYTYARPVSPPLPPNGLDAILVETGVNARQALQPILAASAGVLAGAGTGTIIIKGGNSATPRIIATTDGDGNRTAVTLTLDT